MTIAPADLPESATLLSAVLFLMTKHAQSACPQLRRAIAMHFGWLARHPGAEVSAAQRRLYATLAAQWDEMAIGARPHNAELAAFPAVPGGYLQ